jgi:hypothetical protein
VNAGFLESALSLRINAFVIFAANTLLILSWGFYMSLNRLLLAGSALVLTLASSTYGMAADKNTVGSGKIKHVLLLSVDGMHAVDFYNCTHGIAGVNGGSPYCPNMAALGHTAINYVNAESSKPSDSFPGMVARCAREEHGHWLGRRDLHALRNTHRDHHRQRSGD